MRLALYQPDIPQNAGNLLRTAACFGVAVDIIGPCGFVLDDRRLRRAGLDYLDLTASRYSTPAQCCARPEVTAAAPPLLGPPSACLRAYLASSAAIEPTTPVQRRRAT